MNTEKVWEKILSIKDEGIHQKWLVTHSHSGSYWIRCSHESREVADRCAELQEIATGDPHFVDENSRYHPPLQ